MLKRLFDILIVLLFAPAWIPVVVIVAVLIGILLGWPVFFFQDRGGWRGSVFRLVKFRTMLDTCDAGGRLLPDADRLTKFGRFLRATSLDELPELWNVVRGEMSLVGPRPLLATYLPRYTPRQARRHDVRPGLTGLAQVEGRNALTWEEKFEWDLRYVESRSLWLDVKILCRTVAAVLLPRGISGHGDATMPEFSPIATPAAKDKSPAPPASS